MAHIQDRWYRKAVDPGSGKITREKTTLHGKGDRYKARYVDPDGTERSKTFPDRQKKQAEDFLIAVENDKREGRYLDPRGSRVTFREQAENWIKGQSDDPATRAVLRSRLRSKILPVLGGLLVSRISPSTIREWMETAEDQSDNYKHALFTLATSALDSAVEDKLIRQNPCKVKTIQRPAGAADQVKDVWSEQRVKAVRDAMSACWRIIVPLGAGCGLRQGEILGLSPDDIDGKAMVVQVRRQLRTVDRTKVFALPKGNKTRTVPLSAGVHAEIQRHLRAYPPVTVTLPWRKTTGEPTTVRLLAIDGIFGRPGPPDGLEAA
jgi:integrase